MQRGVSNLTRVLIVPALVATMAGWTAEQLGIAAETAATSESSSSQAEAKMTIYQLALLRKGPDVGQSREEGAKIQAGHIAHLESLEKSGKLVGAGPIEGDPDLRGILILTVSTTEEARELVSTDPAIKAGRLIAEIRPWYGIEGIGKKYFEAAKDPKARIPMIRHYLGLLYRGSAWTPERTPETDRLQAAHLENIGKLAREGTLVLAGPFTDGGELRGIFVFKVESLERAAELAATDPAVKAGRLRIDFYPWLVAEGVIP